MRTPLVIVGLGLTVLAAGCGSGSSGSPGAIASTSVVPTPTPTHHHHHSASPAPTVTVSVTPTPTPTVTITHTSAPVVSRCLSSNLTLTLGSGQGAAGTSYREIVLTNKGTAACELDGYPGVSYVDASGALIGKPASKDPGKAKAVTLAASGGQASALLRSPDALNFSPSSCHKTTSDRLRVYPPGETVALFVHDAAEVCTTSAGRNGVAPMIAGNGS